MRRHRRAGWANACGAPVVTWLSTPRHELGVQTLCPEQLDDLDRLEATQPPQQSFLERSRTGAAYHHVASGTEAEWCHAVHHRAARVAHGLERGGVSTSSAGDGGPEDQPPRSDGECHGEHQACRCHRIALLPELTPTRLRSRQD
jgi:hypothetical protein